MNNYNYRVMVSIATTTLAVDPNGWRINTCSFQQDAIMSYGEYQYVVLYQSLKDSDPLGPRVTSIGRKRLSIANLTWDFITFHDYVQTKDDGHNVISMGISLDGIIHMAWDMHGDSIHYRKSVLGLATTKGESRLTWLAASFGPVQGQLDCEDKLFNFDEITYPRFQTLDNGNLLLEFRSGRSGLGDCYIYQFSSFTHKWSQVGMYIHGVENNAYIHGFDYCGGKLHVSWTYRDFVEDRTIATSTSTLQAGPNGPENNHDLHYMYSPDYGLTWYNSKDVKLITPVDIYQDTLAVEIAKYSSIMNQEGQCVEDDGSVHVLGREYGKFFHYWKTSHEWRREQIGDYSAPLFGARGKVLIRNNQLLALLPLNEHGFVIVQKFGDEWNVLHQFHGLDGEPLVDRYSNGICILQREGDPENKEIGGRATGIRRRNIVIIEIV